MFDIGITELGVIAVVALIVIGPERLPRVARTIGTLLGRAQRYVNDVKAEVNREIELDELKKLQTQMQEAAQSVQQQFSSVGTEMQSAVQSFQTGVDQVGTEVSTAAKSIEQSAAGADHGSGAGISSAPSPAGPAGGAPALAYAGMEPTAAAPGSSMPWTPLEEPPMPVEELAPPKPPPAPVMPAPPKPLRDPRAAANVPPAGATDGAGQPVQPSLFQ